MQRVLSTDLWSTVKAIAKKAKRRQAAIAYVTQDLIGLRKGDVLVVNASRAAVRSGATDANLLVKLHERGVRLYNCPWLHAKAILLDETAVIGSGNMSSSSRSKLVEAAIITDSPAAASGVATFIEHLIAPPKRMTKKALTKLMMIDVDRPSFESAGPKGKKPKIPILGKRTWLIGLYQVTKDSPAEIEMVKSTKRDLAKEHSSRPSSFEWIKWPSSKAFSKKCEVGDRVIMVWRKYCKTKLPECVLNSTPVLKRKQRGSITYLFVQNPSSEISWDEFKSVMKELGDRSIIIENKRVFDFEHPLDSDLAEAISRRWPIRSSRRKFRSDV